MRNLKINNLKPVYYTVLIHSLFKRNVECANEITANRSTDNGDIKFMSTATGLVTVKGNILPHYVIVNTLSVLCTEK